MADRTYHIADLKITDYDFCDEGKATMISGKATFSDGFPVTFRLDRLGNGTFCIRDGRPGKRTEIKLQSRIDALKLALDAKELEWAEELELDRIFDLTEEELEIEELNNLRLAIGNQMQDLFSI